MGNWKWLSSPNINGWKKMITWKQVTTKLIWLNHRVIVNSKTWWGVLLCPIGRLGLKRLVSGKTIFTSVPNRSALIIGVGNAPQINFFMCWTCGKGNFHLRHRKLETYADNSPKKGAMILIMTDMCSIHSLFWFRFLDVTVAPTGYCKERTVKTPSNLGAGPLVKAMTAGPAPDKHLRYVAISSEVKFCKICKLSRKRKNYIHI